VVDLTTGEFAGGSPFRAEADEDAQQPIAEMRAKTREAAKAELATLDILFPGEIEALSGDGVIGPATEMRFGLPVYTPPGATEGDYTLSLEHAKAAHAAFVAGDQSYGQAHALNAIGWYHAKLRQYDSALDFCARAAARAGELGDAHGVASASDSLGYAHHHLGDHQQAAECYRRAAEIYAEADDRYFEADTLLHLTDTLQAMGRTPEAVEAAERALRLLEALEHPDTERARRKLRQLAPTP